MKHLALSVLLVLSAIASQAQHLIWKRMNNVESYSATFSPDGNSILSGVGVKPPRVRLLNTTDGSVKWEYKLNDTMMNLLGMCFAGNGQRMAVVEEKSKLVLFDYSTPTPTHYKTIPLGTEWAFSANFSPDNSKLAVGTSEKLMVYDWATGNKIKEAYAHAKWVLCTDWSTTNKIATGGDDGLVRVWDADANPLHTIAGHTDQVWGVRFTPDGNYLVSASDDKTVKIWDVNTGMLVRTLVGHYEGVKFADVSDDGKMIVSCDEGGAIMTWDFNTGNKLLEFSGLCGFHHKVDFAPNGKYVVATCLGEVMLFDITWKTSVDDVPTKQISLSPNPCMDVLQLQSVATIADVRVFDMAGKQCVVSVEIKGKSATIHISQLPAGQYMLRSMVGGMAVVSHFSKQ